MAFDVLSFVMGQQAGKASGGGSSEKVLLAEQTIEGFDYASNYDAYLYNLIPSPFVLTAGETYFVKWDGTVYECVAQDLSAMMAGAVAVGNLSPFGLSGNNEPFIISYATSSNGSGFLAFDTETSHTVKIYQEAISPTTVELDFSDGDMEISAGEGRAFSKVDIPKPENLAAENIANGVNIAGIVGTLAAGGGDIVYKSASVTLTGKHGERVSVDFGFAPDFLLLYFSTSTATVPTFAPFVYLGFSEKMAVNGSAIGQWCIKRRDANTFNIDKYSMSIDYQTDYKYTDSLYNTDETGFNVGGKGDPAPAGTYTVYACKFS